MKLGSLDVESFSGENKKRLKKGKKGQNLQMDTIHTIRRGTGVITVLIHQMRGKSQENLQTSL